MRALILAFALLAGPAAAGVREAVETRLLPAAAAFAERSAELAAAAAADCEAGAVRPAYDAAFDAWLGFGDFRFGPTEAAALGIALWPDDRGFTQRRIAALVAGEDAAELDPGRMAEASVAGRGLFALDMLLGDAALAGYAEGSHACALVQAVAADLAAQAAELEAAWQGFASTLTSAGAPQNATYLSEAEAQRAVYTQVLAALEFDADQRLGRPLGTFEGPRPRLAEAWRTGRPLRNVERSVAAAVALARALADGPLPQTEAALARVERAAANVEDPALQDLADPGARFRAEVLLQEIERLAGAIAAEIGAPLGIAPGFNAQDGD